MVEHTAHNGKNVGSNPTKPNLTLTSVNKIFIEVCLCSIITVKTTSMKILLRWLLVHAHTYTRR